MNRDRFQDLLDINGADLAKWPAAERAAAERLIAGDAGAAGAHDEARRLERLIRRSLAEAPGREGEAAVSRILSGLPRKLPAQAEPGVVISFKAPPIRQRGRFPSLPARGSMFPRAAALGIAATLGILLGLYLAETMTERRALMASEDSADVTAVLSQTDNAIGTF
jgi:hypothetical protein